MLKLLPLLQLVTLDQACKLCLNTVTSIAPHRLADAVDNVVLSVIILIIIIIVVTVIVTRS